MDDEPDDPVSAATVLISLFQNDLAALRIEADVNWQVMQAPTELQQTVLLLSKHIDELRRRVGLLEIEARTPWWRRAVDWLKGNGER